METQNPLDTKVEVKACPFCGHRAELRQPIKDSLEACLLAEPDARCSNVADRCPGRYLVCSLTEWNRRAPAPQGAAAAQAQPCGTCGGTRKVDSGGQDGAGQWIERDCPECAQAQAAPAPGGVEASHADPIGDPLAWMLAAAEARNSDPKARTVTLKFSRATLEMWMERARTASPAQVSPQEGEALDLEAASGHYCPPLGAFDDSRDRQGCPMCKRAQAEGRVS